MVAGATCERPIQSADDPTVTAEMASKRRIPPVWAVVLDRSVLLMWRSGGCQRSLDMIPQCPIGGGAHNAGSAVRAAMQVIRRTM